MSFLADENLPTSLVARLRGEGLDVEHVFETMRGSDDETVLGHAVTRRAVILTADKDFGDLVIARGLRAHGVVLIRLHPIRQHLDEIVNAILEHAPELEGAFVVVQEGRVRIRRLGTGAP